MGTVGFCCQFFPLALCREVANVLSSSGRSVGSKGESLIIHTSTRTQLHRVTQENITGHLRAFRVVQQIVPGCAVLAGIMRRKTELSVRQLQFAGCS